VARLLLRFYEPDRGPRAGRPLARWSARPEVSSLKMQNFESRFIELAHMRLRKNLQ
jgi:hypothetical protein